MRSLENLQIGVVVDKSAARGSSYPNMPSTYTEYRESQQPDSNRNNSSGTDNPEN